MIRPTAEEMAGRPKLKLAPRTKKVESKVEEVTEGMKKASIFGSGRARDANDPELRQRMEAIEKKKERQDSVEAEVGASNE